MEIFLELDGIKGESQAQAFKDQIEVLAWSWGAANSGTTHIGGGGGSGKVSVQHLTISKYVDAASHALWLACCNGGHYSKAKLTTRRAGADSTVNYLVIELETITVSSISTAVDRQDPDRQTETVAFNFARFKYSYTPEKPDGTAGSTMEMGWDIPKNAEQ